MDTKQQFSFWYFVAVLVAVLLIQSTLFAQHSETLQYSEFKTLLKQGKVDNVTIAEQAITGTLKNDGLEGLLPPAKVEELKPFGKGNHPFVTVRVADPGLTADLEAAKIPFGAQIENKWMSTLIAWVGLRPLSSS